MPPEPLDPQDEGEEDLALLIERFLDERNVSPQEFGELYDARREGDAASFTSLASLKGGRRPAVTAAVAAAVDRGFVASLWSALVKRVGEGQSGDLARRIEAVLVGAVDFQMQGLVSTEGLRDGATIEDLWKGLRATALIIVGRPPKRGFGTGFLVGPDLLITAGHVIEPLLDGDKPRPGSEADIVVKFYSWAGRAGPPKEVFVPKDQWLVDYSPSAGKPPFDSDGYVNDIHKKLDYALIRLASPLDIDPLDIKDPPPTIIPKDRFAVIGHAGGSDTKTDDRLLGENPFDASAARIRHGANAIDGMSGSVCIDGGGKVVGIHEGGVKIAGAAGFNRAVHLHTIRKRMSALNPDPLLTKLDPLWHVNDREARDAWFAYGEAHPPGGADAWRSRAAPFAPGADADAFHPVISRADFQAWIDAGLSSSASQPVALVAGERGAGKSFSATVLRARLAFHGARPVVVAGAQLRQDPIGSVLEALYLEAAGEPPPPPAALGEVPRPLAGALRRDLIPDALDQIDAKRQVTGKHRLLWLIVDIADALMTAETAPAWKELLRAAAERQWLRLVITGLTEISANEFAEVLPDPDAAFVETLALTLKSFKLCAGFMLRTLAPAVTPEDWNDRVNTIYQDVLAVPAENRMTMAVYALLELRRSIQEASFHG